VKHALIPLLLVPALAAACAELDRGRGPVADAEARSRPARQPRSIGVTVSPDLIFTGRPIEPVYRSVQPRWEVLLEGAQQGAGKTVMAGFGAGAVHPYFFALGLGLWPVGALVGGANGAARSKLRALERPLGSVPGAQAMFEAALRGRRIEHALESRLVAAFFRDSAVPLPHERFSFERLTYLPAAERARELGQHGLDGVLDVHVTAFDLTGEDGTDPRAALRLNVETRWLVEGSAPPFADWAYEGESRSLSAWAADGARPFREELDRALATLAERIVKADVPAPAVATASVR
jgi:hypothetical protein